MRLIEKSGTLQILNTLRESSVKEDVSDLVDTEEEVLLGSEDIDAESVNIKDRKPIAGFYAGRGNSDPGIAIYEIRYGIDDEVLALDLAKGSDEAHWYKIENELVDEDGNDLEEPRAYIDVDGIKVYMDECMRTNLHEAEETVDVFVNPKRDYKITDVTMLEPVDDGDVRAIDMQSILIGLDESLTEKYGAKWGEFNIQSSRTPRGKISENDISYVLHVLNINGHQEILNYNTKGIGRIREAFVTNSRGKVLSSKRCAVSRIPKFFMEATEEFIDKYKDEDDEVYEIEVWDTEEDRDQGYGYLLLDSFKDENEAIDYARKVFDREGKACVEVLAPNGEAVFTIDDEGENIWNKDSAKSSIKESAKIDWNDLNSKEFVYEIDGADDWKYVQFFASSNKVSEEDIPEGDNLEDYGAVAYNIYNANKEEIDGGMLITKGDSFIPEELVKDCLELNGLTDRNSIQVKEVDSEILEESAKAVKEDAVLPNNGYIDQTGLNLVSDERIQDSLRRRVKRLKARQKLLKSKQTFDKKGNVTPVDEKNTHGKEVVDSEIGEETKPITDTKIKESVVTLDTDTGAVDLDGNVSHVTLDADGTMTAVSGGEVITTTANSVEVLPSEETMIADDSVLEPNTDELGGEDINNPEEVLDSTEELETPSEDEVVETNDIAMAEPVSASELEESVEEDETKDTELWCRGKIYWSGNHKDLDENLLLDIADQATEEEGKEIDVDEVEIKKIEESLKDSLDKDEDYVFTEKTSKFKSEEDFRNYLDQFFMKDVEIPFNIFDYEYVILDTDKKKVEPLTEAVEERVESEIEGEDIKTKEETIKEDLVPTAIFHRKCSNTEDMKKEEENKVVTARSEYVVKDVKEVDENEFNDLSNNLLKDRDYIKAFADSVDIDNSVTFNCLEVKGPNGSLLIDPSGYGYARYCAFGNETIKEPTEEIIDTEEVVEEE